MRAVLAVAGVVVLLAAVAVGGLWLVQRRLIYLPATGPVPPAPSALPGAQDVVLRTGDGLSLGAWYVPPPRGPARATVLVASGNAGDRTLRAPLAAALAERGLAVLLFDYRGFGGNEGAPSEEGLVEDARAAYRHLVAERGVDPRRLIYFGESLGCGVVTALALEAPPAGLVLRSPFVDLAAAGEVAYPVLPVRLLLRDRYPVAEQAAALDVPVTVVYGAADRLIPPAQSAEVARAAGAREVVVAGAEHDDAVLGHGRPLVDAVVELADRAVPGR